MRKWHSIPASERASVVEMTRRTPPAPFPVITVALPDVKAWAMGQCIEWDSHDHTQLADAYLAAQYGEVGG